MAGLTLIVLFISHFLVHDCSSVLDLKATASSQETTSKEVGDVVISNEKAQEIEQKEEGSKNETIPVDDDDSVQTTKNNKTSIDLCNKNETTPASDVVKPCEEVKADLENVDAERHTVSSTPSVSTTIHELMTNKDSVLIFISSFLFMYTIFSADILLPLIVADTLMWKQTTLSAIYFAWGAVDLVLLLLIGKVCTSSRYADYSAPSAFLQIYVCLGY